METVKLKGRVYRVIDDTGMTGAGKAWTKRTVIVDTGSEFNNLAPIVFFGDKSSKANVSEGQNVEASLFLGGREYNGKFYPDLSGSEIKVLEGDSTTPTAPPVAPATITNGEQDDLPFSHGV